MIEEIKEWKVIGLMSGTSLDGLDIVCVHFRRSNNGYEFELVATETVPYSFEWEQSLRNAFNATETEITKLNVSYGEYLGDAVNQFINKNNLKDIDFVASHGHTVFHKPDEGYTLQIGDGQALCDKTNLKVICDFRTQDVELGGQGAPLVPIGDRLLFSNFQYCLNLGGFANISFEENNKRIAFDICPINIVLNHYALKLGFPYDKGGEFARKGKVNRNLLTELNDLPYYNAPIPKSLGFEFVQETIFPIIEKYQLNERDVMRTFVEHVAYQISRCLDQNKKSKLLITGGGAFNTFFIDELRKIVTNEIEIPSVEIIDFKEAIIFALLGVLRIENNVNCLRSVTGALKDHSSGKIFSVDA